MRAFEQSTLPLMQRMRIWIRSVSRGLHRALKKTFSNGMSTGASGRRPPENSWPPDHAPMGSSIRCDHRGLKKLVSLLSHSAYARVIRTTHRPEGFAPPRWSARCHVAADFVIFRELFTKLATLSVRFSPGSRERFEGPSSRDAARRGFDPSVPCNRTPWPAHASSERRTNRLRPSFGRDPSVFRFSLFRRLFGWEPCSSPSKKWPIVSAFI